MFRLLLVLGFVAAGIAGVVQFWRMLRIRRLTRERLADEAELAEPPEPEAAWATRPFLRRHRWLPWAAGAAIGCLLYFVLGWAAPFAVALGVIAALLTAQFEAHFANRKTARIESQLADAVDLMVGTLGAGAGVNNALETAMNESKRPLRPQLEEVVGRIRLGDHPPTVFHGLVRRVPLETFLLFSSALAVHWETGGSLAPTLSTLGRTIRDRIEMSRRIRANVTQSHLSTLAVLGLTYLIALIMWLSNPEHMRAFLASPTGQWFLAVTMLLQAVGIAWMAAISRLKF